MLEAYLPSAQGLLQLAAQHATGGGADERFAASQLMRVAGACMVRASVRQGFVE